MLVYALDGAVAGALSGPAAQTGIFALGRNVPNPFRSATTIDYELASRAAVRLRIFDVSGRIVRDQPEHAEPAGSHAYRWDGRDDSGAPVASGAYLYELRVNGETRVRKSILVR